MANYASIFPNPLLSRRKREGEAGLMKLINLPNLNMFKILISGKQLSVSKS